MQHVFWLIENKLAGRPGPDLEPWNLIELHNAGIRAILSVNSGDSIYADGLKLLGMSYCCIPLTPDAPPLPGDQELCLQRLPEALSFVNSEIEKDQPVLVHCRQGKDRTGLFMAYYLRKKCCLSPEESIEEVKRRRPIALTADGWHDFALEILHSC